MHPPEHPYHNGEIRLSFIPSNKRVPPVIEPDSPIAERRSTAIYETSGAVRKAIRALKYGGRPDLAEPLGARLIEEYQQANWQPTLITAVPLSPARLRERGYSQAALLAEVVSRAVGVPFHRETLRKIKDVRSQVGLRYKARQTNVAGAFVAEPDLARDQRVVLVDDVCTTGATLKACAGALVAAGASVVYGLTVASTKPEKKPERVRHASIRIVKMKDGYRYAQLVFADNHSLSLGAFNPITPTPLLDHILLLTFNRKVDLASLLAIREARKDWRDWKLTWRDLELWAG